MTAGLMTRAIQSLRQAVEAHAGGDLTDRELLERFAVRGDEAAFARLVRRHGPMVLGVCRRVLGSHHDAEDAFQAAFLILARRAAAVRWHDSAGGWLFRVAYHLALKMKADADRKRTVPLPDVPGPDPAARGGGELHMILDEELSRLPEKYRAVLLLCHGEGKSRAEAARELGWKEGAVKVRLERGRKLLRDRLARRGVAVPGLVVGSLLAREVAAAAVPPTLARVTASSAASFARGMTPAAASLSAVALAGEVLRTMMKTRLHIAALVALSVALLSVGLGTYRAFSQTSAGVTPPPAQAGPRGGAAAAPAPAGRPQKPLRVLLFAGGPTREYQFVRTVFAAATKAGRAELGICLQTGGPNAVHVVHDVPSDRFLSEFPRRLGAADKTKEPGDLAAYDVLIAFDPDWTRLSEEQGALLERWVGKEGRGLVLVAGPVSTHELARPVNARKLKPVLDLLPVRLGDRRLVEAERDTSRPWPLAFPAAEMFFDLDGKGKDPLSGWSEFFFGKQRDDWQKTEDQPVRGFYAAYPVQRVKPAATVFARFRDSSEQPYLVAMPYGKGRTVYLGSGETWRLRQLSPEYHERFWVGLARYAASADPAPSRTPSARAPAITPEQSKAADTALVWLRRNQHRDGHWEDEGGTATVGMTALAGMALLMQGSTLREGEYANELRRAVDWLMAHSRRDGLLVGPGKQANAGDDLDGHGRALLLLASVYGEEEDAERRRRLQDILTRAVEVSAGAQTSGGGWGHHRRGQAKEKDGRADVAATAIQVEALRAARAAGIAVPRKALDAGLRYLEQKVKPATPAAVLALAAFGPEGYASPAARKWLRSARKLAPTLNPAGKRHPGEDTALFAYALVAYSLGEDGYTRLFPGTAPEDRIRWGEVRWAVLEHLLKTQGGDGSWESEAGKVRATALRLAILQLDYGAVPIYQR
jgi:RNA polymerase sigma factor (sigma-70 family)